MSRLPNRGFTAQAPQTAAQWPNIPDLSGEISKLDAGTTNAALKRWNDLCARRIEANDVADSSRFREVKEINDRQNDFLSTTWTMQAIAGPVVTGMELFSSVNRKDHTVVSRITFQADVFQVQTASGVHKQVFSTSADEILLGDVLTIDLANSKIYMGAGNFGNEDTPFYVDQLANFSLGEKLTWDGDLLTVGNAYIDSVGAIVLGTGGNVLILSAADPDFVMWGGNLDPALADFRVSKTGVLFADGPTLIGEMTFAAQARVLATDNLDYLDWQGSAGLNVPGFYAQHETAASGGFIALGVGTNATSALVLTKARGSFGALTAVAADDIMGVQAFQAYTGSVWSTMVLIRGGITHDTTTPYYFINASGNYWIFNYDGKLYFDVVGPADGFGVPYVSDTLANLYRSAAGTMKTDGVFIAAGGFSGSGAALTALNASNISSGTLDNARLSFSATGSGDVPINGFVAVGGVKLATVA